MAAITLETARTMLQTWLDAEKAVAMRQEFQIGGQRYTATDAAVITDKINYWRREVSRLETGRSGGPRVRFAVPR